MQTEPAGVEVEVDGLLLAGSDAHRDYLEKIRDRRREAYMAELLAETVRPGATMVDAGAYVGYFTLVAARATGPSGQVFAFEPDPRDFPWLQRNLDRNGLADRVTVVPKAVAERDGSVPFFFGHDQSQSSMFPMLDPGGARPGSVPAIALDGYLDGAAVDVLKIDVEGAEIQALEGMHRTLEGSPSVKLFIEWNPTLLTHLGADPMGLPDRLQDLGFTVRLIDEGSRRLAPLPAPDAVNYVNLFCTRD